MLCSWDTFHPGVYSWLLQLANLMLGEILQWKGIHVPYHLGEVEILINA